MDSQSETYKNSVFLSPKSIAIIGASEKPGIGRAIFTTSRMAIKVKSIQSALLTSMFLELRHTRVFLTYQRI